jgi:hypothetical protein
VERKIFGSKKEEAGVPCILHQILEYSNEGRWDGRGMY